MPFIEGGERGGGCEVPGFNVGVEVPEQWSRVAAGVAKP